MPVDSDWKRALLDHRIRELATAAIQTHGRKRSRAVAKIESAIYALKHGTLDSCERHCELAEHYLLQERRVLEGKPLHDNHENQLRFIERLRISVPPEVHPMTKSIIREQLIEMRDAATDDDGADLLRLAKLIHYRIIRDLRWEAETATELRRYQEAYRLRRRADKFEAVYGRGEQ